MEIVQVINPRALDSALMGDFLRRVFPPDSIALPGGFAARPGRLGAMLADPNVALWIGVEDGELRGCGLAWAPEKLDTMLPQVLQFYNEGSPALRRALIEAVVAFFKARGHMKCWIINATGRPDSIWARAMRAAGPSRRVGSIMEITFSDQQAA